MTPNDPSRGRTAPLTSKRCILYIYSTNIGTEYFKHGIYSSFFPPLQNAVSFIILTYLVPVLFTFYIQDVLKLKKKSSGAKRLSFVLSFSVCLSVCLSACISSTASRRISVTSGIGDFYGNMPGENTGILLQSDRNVEGFT